MAISIPIISEFNDKGIKGAQRAFDDLRRNVGNAEGAFGKMKAGFGTASDYIKANAGTMASIAGGAIASFVANAIGDFQNLALSVDKFRDASGLTLDAASRWTEVAGDIGVDAGAIETAINKMNRKVADSPKLFEDLGIEMAKHKDGTYDPQGTFLNVIDTLKNMKDPAEKATTATAILGKGWMELADLIEKGSSDLSKSLASVSQAKIIDENEVKKAQEYRDRVSDLKDAWEDFSLKIGEAVVPMLTDLIDVLNPVVVAVGDLAGMMGDAKSQAEELPSSLQPAATQMGLFQRVIGFAADKLGLYNDEADDLTDATDKDVIPAIDGMRDAWIKGYRAMIDARNAAKEIEDRLYDVDYALATLEGNISERETFRKLQDDIKNAGDAAWTAFVEKTPEALRASEGALDDARLSAANYILKLDDIPDEMKTEIIADLDRADIQEIERILKELTRTRTVTILTRTRPAEVGSGGREQGAPPPGTVGNIVDTPFGRFRDLGGGAFEPVNLGTSTRSATATNVTVNVAGSVTSERDLVESVRKGLVDAQRSGYGLLYTNS